MRNPSVWTSLLVHPDGTYDASHAWIDGGGQVRASVSFDAGGTSHGATQSPPAALRELAAAVLAAADHADATYPAGQLVTATQATR